METGHEIALDLWGLWEPDRGWVRGTVKFLSEEAAYTSLADRLANGQAFPEETVERVWLKTYVTHDGKAIWNYAGAHEKSARDG